MKVKTTKSKRLMPRGKFAVLAADFLKNGEECLWNQLRAEKAVEIDAKALLKGNGLETPSGHSTKSFIEFELGVEVLKCSKGEEAIVGVKKQAEEEAVGIDALPEIEQEELQEIEKDKSGGEN